ncbi:hypothetical protein GALMADRAFT_255691 [Galerina marginata CBS 339.88]|uniref:Uncharacterized protein n=1 Tax=Galerina marginata (strain CBS 339.88) TaxID=685588 RepID=A0A067SFZ2_GALM3|nr:hypothetical protein GALMADRAFT_255691 [Galerina marginata CBS 339.88]
MSQDVQIGHEELVAIGICSKDTIVDVPITSVIQPSPSALQSTTATRATALPKPRPLKRKAEAAVLEAPLTKKTREN